MRLVCLGVNAARTTGFPHCGKGTDLGLLPFWLKRQGGDDGRTQDGAQNRAKESRKKIGPEGRLRAQKTRDQKDIVKTLVAARHRAKRCARSQARRLQADRSEENRGITKALGGTEFAPQDRRLSLGALDADLLYQPCRQGPAEDATRPAGAGQGRIEAAVREGVSKSARSDHGSSYPRR